MSSIDKDTYGAFKVCNKYDSTITWIILCAKELTTILIKIMYQYFLVVSCEWYWICV